MLQAKNSNRRTVTEFTVLETVNPNLRVIYVVAALPWPVWDRDILYIFARDTLSPEENG